VVKASSEVLLYVHSASIVAPGGSARTGTAAMMSGAAVEKSDTESTGTPVADATAVVQTTLSTSGVAATGLAAGGGVAFAWAARVGDGLAGSISRGSPPQAAKITVSQTDVRLRSRTRNLRRRILVKRMPGVWNLMARHGDMPSFILIKRHVGSIAERNSTANVAEFWYVSWIGRIITTTEKVPRYGEVVNRGQPSIRA
jgi:dienelactone hydrolase